jgi:hypothetical protein
VVDGVQSNFLEEKKCTKKGGGGGAGGSGKLFSNVSIFSMQGWHQRVFTTSTEKQTKCE